MYSIKGEIIHKGEVQQVTDSFKKQEIVIKESSSQYPQEVVFQAVQDRTNLLNDFSKGDLVEIEFFLRGKSYQKDPNTPKRWFNSLDLYTIKKL